MRPRKSPYAIFPLKDRRKLPKEHDYWYSVYSKKTAFPSILLSGAELTEYYSFHSGIRIGPKEHNYRQFRVFSSRNCPKRTRPKLNKSSFILLFCKIEHHYVNFTSKNFNTVSKYSCIKFVAINSVAVCLTSQMKEVLSVLMLCAPNNRRRTFSCHTKMAEFVFSYFVHFLVTKLT